MLLLLCADSAQLAHHLGLDASKFASRQPTATHGGLGGVEGEDWWESEQDKFRSVSPFRLSCPSCGLPQCFVGVRRNFPESLQFPVEVREEASTSIEQQHASASSSQAVSTTFRGLLACIGCSKKFSTVYLQNRLTLAIRKLVTYHYQNWVVCSDQACRTRTRQV